MLAFTAAVPSAVMGAVTWVVRDFPALVMALEIVSHFLEIAVRDSPACVHADCIRYSCSVSLRISASVSFTAALALFRSVVALLTASALFCMVFCRALT